MAFWDHVIFSLLGLVLFLCSFVSLSSLSSRWLTSSLCMMNLFSFFIPKLQWVLPHCFASKVNQCEQICETRDIQILLLSVICWKLIIAVISLFKYYSWNRFIIYLDTIHLIMDARSIEDWRFSFTESKQSKCWGYQLTKHYGRFILHRKTLGTNILL